MNISTPRRAYRQSARALAAEETGERILDAFAAELRQNWFDEIKLEDVARDAGVTVQTVIRRFGGKEQLLAAVHDRMGAQILQRREVRPGDAAGVISALVKDYEEIGELVLRSLAQEDRYPAMRAMTDIGRAMHRQWMAAAFEPWLGPMSEEDRRRALDGLVVAGDIYVWKLIRTDLGRPLSEYRDLVEKLCSAAVGIDRAALFKHPETGTLK
ncbi:TetR/AcrR family transcriptional regulator [Sphingomonas xanthus]|uniref:TetR/AcrR family transcriptional regulator n=1 Tax=Sphingomonas xanthus TaxID=2594473 RepID=A0A516ITL9_9SPHN|nr:TetR/AcrR family transcriptional regulator [Sphingomonas xanthus]QDP20262.1 TetR/AcrR family transcriptional regulator [Sphingomonas xanthus]